MSVNVTRIGRARLASVASQWTPVLILNQRRSVAAMASVFVANVNVLKRRIDNIQVNIVKNARLVQQCVNSIRIVSEVQCLELAH